MSRLCVCLHRYSIYGYSFMVGSEEECKQEEDEEFKCNIFDPKEVEVE
jgi:hypothetical protein